MIVGDPSSFAIESEIAKVFSINSQLALGFFVIHVSGRTFGVREPEASLLGCSFFEVKSRLARRGTHCFPVLDDIAASSVADAYLDAIYRETPRTAYFGLSREGFADAMYASAIAWAPDGDAAFDDGGHVLQMDVGGKVRLIAFENTGVREELAISLREEWLEAELFYDVLLRWSTRFAVERTLLLGQMKAVPT